ncbi:hypothetical protein [Streptomyces sp. NPDC059708]|uniref:hypothetical protein n=1 Tax=Streptomyces sp. NPDC059708 TaxID=3346916 RepID=UPI00367782D9
MRKTLVTALLSVTALASLTACGGASEKPEPAKASGTASIGACVEEHGLYLKCPVTVKNLSDRQSSFSVTAEVFDTKGDRTASNIAFVNDIKAGVSRTDDLILDLKSNPYLKLGQEVRVKSVTAVKAP